MCKIIYTKPVDYAIDPFAPTYSSMEEEIHAGVDKLKNEFDGRVYEPDTHAKFHMMMKTLNCQIAKRWNTHEYHIDGFIYPHGYHVGARFS